MAFLALIAAALYVHFKFGVEIADRWVGLTIFTPLPFWAAIKTDKRHRRRPSFWLALLMFLAIHLAVMYWALSIYPNWRVIWFVPIVIVEAGMIGAALAWIFESDKDSRVRTGRLGA